MAAFASSSVKNTKDRNEMSDFSTVYVHWEAAGYLWEF